MAKRKLSLLQEEYQKFFRKRLEDFDTTSPAKLDLEEKRTFFKGIPSKWSKMKKELNKGKKGSEEKTESSTPIKDKEYKDVTGTVYIVSSIDQGNVELVQLKDAANVLICSAYEFKSNFTPVIALVQADDDSPLNIALIETSEVVATLNSLMRTVLRMAPEDVKEATREAIRASKILLQKLAIEVREDY